MRYDTAGTLLDSIVQPTASWLPAAPPTTQEAPRQWWSMVRDGRLLYSRTDKVGYLLVDRTGARKPVLVEAASERVPYLKEEREELQALRDFSVEKCSRPGEPPRPRVVVPESKFPAGGAQEDVSGRLWVRKTAPAMKVPPKIGASCGGSAGSFQFHVTWEEPPAFVAFQPDGTLLGEVRFPVRARVTFVGNTAWALVPDEDDVLTLVKYRLPR
jgi:hypothetical protein